MLLEADPAIKSCRIVSLYGSCDQYGRFFWSRIRNETGIRRTRKQPCKARLCAPVLSWISVRTRSGLRDGPDDSSNRQPLRGHASFRRRRRRRRAASAQASVLLLFPLAARFLTGGGLGAAAPMGRRGLRVWRGRGPPGRARGPRRPASRSEALPSASSLMIHRKARWQSSLERRIRWYALPGPGQCGSEDALAACRVPENRGAVFGLPSVRSTPAALPLPTRRKAGYAAPQARGRGLGDEPARRRGRP